MKFTKEDACKKLAEEFSKKVENIASWERTINENVETLFSLLGENDTITLEEFCLKAVPLLDTAAGHIRKENSDLAKSYEKRIKEIEDKLKTKEGPKPKSEDDEVKQLMERIKNLEEKNLHEEEERAVSLKRTQLIDKIKELGVKDAEWTEAILSKASIGKDTDVDAEAKSYVEIYNKMNAKTPPSITPKGTGGKVPDYIQDTINAAAEFAKGQRLAN